MCDFVIKNKENEKVIKEMIYIGVLPYDKDFVTSMCARLYIHNFYEGSTVEFGGCLGTIFAMKYSNSILFDHFGKPILFNGLPITHKESYEYAEKCIRSYKRRKKLERVCK